MVDDFDEDFFNEDDDKKTKKKSKKKKKSLLNKKTLKKLKKHKTKFIISAIVIIIAIIALIYFGMPKLVDNKIIARVNGDGISAQDLDDAYEMFFLITGYPEQYRQIIPKESFLDQLINEELLLQKAAELEIEANDEETDAIFNNVLQNSGLTEEELSAQLATKGFDTDDLKAYYKKQLTLTKLVNETIFNKIDISDEEIKEYYDLNIDMFKTQEGQIHVSHILVETREEAKELLIELQNGADFKELAMEKSIEPAAQTTGGDLGFFGKGQMVAEFEDAAFDLKIEGQLSGPIETQFGWHIIKKESNTISLEDAKQEIINMLKVQEEQEILKEYVDELRENADIEIYEQETSEEGIFSELDENETEEYENKTEEEIVEEIDTEIEEIKCIQEYGISEDTIIFYYATWSPRSKAMIPIVNELSSEGYKFYMADIDTDNVDMVYDCFDDVVSEHIPEFICAGSRSVTAGEMSKESLQKFADLCVG